jgi:uncharacterized membrane protein
MKNWLYMIGSALAIYGVFRLVSGVWGPDAVVTAGPNNALVSGIVIAVGVVVLIAAYVTKKPA